MAGIKDLITQIPPEYRLYLQTMFPGQKTGTIDEGYFSQDFKDQLKDQVLSKIEMGLGFDSPPVSDESMRFMFPYGTVRKGTIFPQDYRTAANPAGTTDPKYYKGERGSSPTGYSSPFNTLGTYQYEYKMPTAPAFDNAAIVVTDKYDWNPMYGTVPEQNFTGYIGEGFGKKGDEDYVEGSDVDAKMLFEFVKNQIKNKELDTASALELIGNYLGPRESEGEGRDIRIEIPVDTPTATIDDRKKTDEIRKKDLQQMRGPIGRDDGPSTPTRSQNVARTASRVGPGGRVRAYGLKEGGRVNYALGSPEPLNVSNEEKRIAFDIYQALKDIEEQYTGETIAGDPSPQNLDPSDRRQGTLMAGGDFPEFENYADVIDAYNSGVAVEPGESLTDYIKRNNIKIKEIDMDPLDDLKKVELVDELEPGPLKDELKEKFDPSQETYEEYLRRINLDRPFNAADGGRVKFDRGGVAQVKAYVESLPKNTVVTRKLIKDFIEANDVNVNFENLFNKNRPAYVGNFIKDKSITIDASYPTGLKAYKKSKAIMDDPKKLKEFLKYGNQKGITIKDILKKYKIGSEEFYEGGLRELFDKDFQTQAVSQIKNKTINNVNKLLNDSEAASFLKKGNVVPDDVLARLKILPGEAATATVRIGQIYGGNNFGIDDFKKIRKNIKVSDKLFDTMNKFQFGNPYRSKLYKTSLELIDQQLGNEKGTFESLKNKAKYILQKNKIKGFDINEIAGVTGTAKTGAGEFSQFIDVLDSNLNQKQGAAFQSAFSNARQKIAANPAVFETEARKINKLASKFESEYGFKLPRIRRLEDVEKFYSPKRLADLTKQGIDIKKASEKLGYTIEMPKGAVTAQEFVEKPGLKEKFLKGIGTGAKAFGKVIKPVGYAIGTAAAYQAKGMADEMGIELSPLDYAMAVDSGDPEIAINNYKRRIDPEFAAQERAKDLAKMSDDFTEVGNQVFTEPKKEGIMEVADSVDLEDLTDNKDGLAGLMA